MTLTAITPDRSPARVADPSPWASFLEGWLPEAGGSDTAALHRLAAGTPRLLGELLTDVKPDRAAAVARALEESKRLGERVGETLVRHGVLTAPERDVLLEFQRHLRGSAPTDSRFRIGNVLVSQGHLTEEDLASALDRQRTSGRPLGEELVAEGRITRATLGSALDVQHMLVTAALAAALAMAGMGTVTPAEAAQSLSQSVNFTIRIPPMVRVQMVRQPTALQVTQEDIARGYVEVQGASLMQVTSNTPWEVNFRPSTSLIRSARVSGLGGDVVVGPEGASHANLMATRRASDFELSYRFELSPSAQPGTHPWPLAVSTNAV